MVIHGAHAVLRVVIVANVLACLRVQVALIILIEEVCKLNIIGLCELIVALQARRKVAITVVTVLRSVTFAEEIACFGRHFQPFYGSPRELFLDVPRAVSKHFT